jgi:hypothetical protein
MMVRSLLNGAASFMHAILGKNIVGRQVRAFSIFAFSQKSVLFQ